MFLEIRRVRTGWLFDLKICNFFVACYYFRTKMFDDYGNISKKAFFYLISGPSKEIGIFGSPILIYY